jgi:ribosomal protein S18 acetylase RimI-like enzyme
MEAMGFQFRFGQETDAPQVADLVLEAGRGVLDVLFDGLVPGIKATDFIRIATTADDSPLNVANCLIAENETGVVGIALSYPSAEYGLHPVLRNLLPARRIKTLMPLLESRVEDSWYLNSLIVNDEYRSQGLGQLLLGLSAELGSDAGLHRMSLHARADNHAALAFYQRCGFTVTEAVPIASLGCDMLLLASPLPLTLNS